MLSSEEVEALVTAYRRGETERSLAKRFGVHPHTVSRHLKRAGVAKRPTVKMTPTRTDRAQELYRQGWSSKRIGQELGVDATTVRKALKRAGVKLRPPVA